MKNLFVLLFLSIFGSIQLYAVHLRAANIEVERVSGSNTQYLVRLTVFSDDETDAYNGTPSGVEVIDPQEIYLNNEPEAILIPAVSKGVSVGNNTNKTIFEKVINIPSPNGKFFIKWNGQLRNEGIINITTATAIPYELFVETFFYLNGFDAPNNTPRMTIDPVDKGYVNTVYTYNSGAYDVDGDSLSYELINIQAGSKNSSGALIGADIPSAVSPADPAIGGGGSLSIDPVRGTVTWDSPRLPGEYNIAIKINEWRNGIRIGYVIRDMQIIIEDTDLEPPLLKIPNDTCVAAGTILDANIFAWDENNDQVALEHYGLPKELGANLTVNKITLDSLVADYSWSIDCGSARQQPYYSYFKATNNPNKSFKLTTYKEWAIEVIGAAVENVTATEVTQGVNLSWDSYCPASTGISSLEVWRRSCDLANVTLDYCTTGVPDEWGFTKIATVDKNATSYLDETIFKGSKYYYIVIAKISDINTGYSIPSSIDSIETTIDGPWVTHASVLKHDSIQGEILVNWSFSSVFNEAGPYQIELLRSNDLTEGTYTSIDTLQLTTIKDSFFIDKQIDTYNGTFSYKIKVYFQTDQLFSESEAVSIIDATALADERDITLSWQANAPLFTPDSLYNKIHRDYFTYNLLDSTQGENYSYLDSDLQSDSLFCYYVVKPTTYCNQEMDSLFYVTSNISCDTTYDFTPPCPPILSLQPLDCEQYDPTAPIQNELWWEWDVYTCSVEKIEYYELYYRAKEEDDFQSILKTTDTFYIHQFIDTYAGCYKIRAKDKSGNVGVFSNEVCNDNCEFIEFPNVVTPNEDGKNDVFGPIPVPQFVDKIQFSVTNRWGQPVYQSDENIEVLWDLKTSNGKDAVDGVYYYSATVTFDKYKRSDREVTYKGWFLIVK